MKLAENGMLSEEQSKQVEKLTENIFNDEKTSYSLKAGYTPKIEVNTDDIDEFGINKINNLKEVKEKMDIRRANSINNFYIHKITTVEAAKSHQNEVTS